MKRAIFAAALSLICGASMAEEIDDYAAVCEGVGTHELRGDACARAGRYYLNHSNFQAAEFYAGQGCVFHENAGACGITGLTYSLRDEDLAAYDYYVMGCKGKDGYSCGMLSAYYTNERLAKIVGNKVDKTKARELNERACNLKSAADCFALSVVSDGYRKLSYLKQACEYSDTKNAVGANCGFYGEALSEMKGAEKEAENVLRVACRADAGFACLIFADLLSRGKARAPLEAIRAYEKACISLPDSKDQKLACRKAAALAQ